MVVSLTHPTTSAPLPHPHRLAGRSTQQLRASYQRAAGANATICHIGASASTAALFWLIVTDPLDDIDGDISTGTDDERPVLFEDAKVVVLSLGASCFQADLLDLSNLLFAHRKKDDGTSSLDTRTLNHPDALSSLVGGGRDGKFGCDLVVVDSDSSSYRRHDDNDASFVDANYLTDVTTFSQATIMALVGDHTGGIRPHTLFFSDIEPRARKLRRALEAANRVVPTVSDTSTQHESNNETTCVHVRGGRYLLVPCPSGTLARAHPSGPLWEGRFVQETSHDVNVEGSQESSLTCSLEEHHLADRATAEDAAAKDMATDDDDTALHVALTVCCGENENAARYAQEAFAAIASAVVARDNAASTGQGRSGGGDRSFLHFHIVADAAARTLLEADLECLLSLDLGPTPHSRDPPSAATDRSDRRCASSAIASRRRLHVLSAPPAHRVSWIEVQ